MSRTDEAPIRISLHQLVDVTLRLDEQVRRRGFQSALDVDPYRGVDVDLTRRRVTDVLVVDDARQSPPVDCSAAIEVALAPEHDVLFTVLVA